MLDLTSLRKAVANLDKLLAGLANIDLIQALDQTLQDGLKAGAVQNFEVTYELCWKFIKRWLENNLGNSYADGVSRRELFRLAAESRLIANVDQWMIYHKGRNETSHTYDVITADEVYDLAKVFIHDAKKLLQTLEEKND